MRSHIPARPDRTAVVPTLLAAQLVFNIGFYAVVPFLAVHLHDDLAASGTAIAVVLAVRTFGQQGLFVVGGSLADRFGARRVMVAGTAVRVAGYLGLAVAGSVPPLLGAAVLTGAGGALFSPALESLLAGAADDTGTGRRSGTRLFALLAVFGETGAVLGPVAGALLIGAGFPVLALSGAAVFAVAGVVLWLVLPADRGAFVVTGTGSRRAIPSWRAAATDRPFLIFCLAYSSYLVSYQQLYTALPVELDRVGAADVALAWLFLGAAVLIVVGQLPVQRWTAGGRPGRVLSAGFGLMAAGFAVVAGCAPFAPAGGALAVLPSACLVALLTTGQMMVVPVAMDQVPRFAGRRPLGAYYGLLATAGGCAVLLSAVLFGPFLDAGRNATPAARMPWLLMAVLPTASAATMPMILRRRPADPT